MTEALFVNRAQRQWCCLLGNSYTNTHVLYQHTWKDTARVSFRGVPAVSPSGQAVLGGQSPRARVRTGAHRHAHGVNSMGIGVPLWSSSDLSGSGGDDSTGANASNRLISVNDSTSPGEVLPITIVASYAITLSRRPEIDCKAARPPSISILRSTSRSPIEAASARSVPSSSRSERYDPVLARKAIRLSPRFTTPNCSWRPIARLQARSTP